MPDVFLSTDHLLRTIQSRLNPGESLLWVGQPDPSYFSREGRLSFFFQFILIAVFGAVCWYVIFPLSRMENAVLPAVLLGGSLIVNFLIAAPGRYPERVLRAIYAVTDRRVLVYHGFGWSLLRLQALPNLYNTLWSFDPREIRARRRVPRYEERIDLVFSGENHNHMTGRGQIRDRVQVGFLGLKNIDEVDQLLEKHFAQADAERG